jgi:hypothetical protein
MAHLGISGSFRKHRVPHWYDPGKEASMIELTEQQVEALEHAAVTPPRVPQGSPSRESL